MTADDGVRPDVAAALRGAVDAGFGTALADLTRLTAIPAIAWPGFDPAELDRSAALTVRLLADCGLDDVRVLHAGQDGDVGAPAVLGRRAAAPGAPTVLLYAHHDVQPPGPGEQWTSPPFTATRRGGRLHGRGVADDKAGIMLHVAALRALHSVLGADLRLGVTVFVEGEEEAGSPTLATFLAEHRKALRADVVVVADSGNWQVGVPALTTSLRGLVDGVVATAKISLRIPPGNDPETAMAALARHVRIHAPFGAQATFRPGAAGAPYAVDPAPPAARAMHDAMHQAWGRPAVDMGVGGSIPVVAELARLLPDAQILITGAEDPDTRAHGIDESLDVEDLRRGVLAEALLLARLDAGIGTGDSTENSDNPD
ncbi:M20/M25/M40 family metallo-hydrolase [Tersicoccus sp. MR15.9]|uniref:M20/M25/M40 family metallo-hydrolase n=1 Tax=Tersicoccus mangrovi TaxID=3121635 RepID=UPI002FE6BD4C